MVSDRDHDRKVYRWLIVLPAALIVLFTVLFMRKVEAGILLNIALAIVAAGLLVSSFFSIAPSALSIIASNGIPLCGQICSREKP